MQKKYKISTACACCFCCSLFTAGSDKKLRFLKSDLKADTVITVRIHCLPQVTACHRKTNNYCYRTLCSRSTSVGWTGDGGSSNQQCRHTGFHSLYDTGIWTAISWSPPRFNAAWCGCPSPTNHMHWLDFVYRGRRLTLRMCQDQNAEHMGGVFSIWLGFWESIVSGGVGTRA